MFEKFMSTNAGDFRQRYRGTYGFYTNNGKRTLVQLVDVSAERGVVLFADEKGQQYKLNVDHDDTIGFSFLPPRSAWHQTVTGPYFVRRVAARQFQRGICEANTAIRRTGGRAVHVGFEALSDIFEKQITPKEAVVAKGDAIAVSPQFAVDTGLKKIWCFDQQIGKATKKDDHYSVELTDPEMFGVEVVDAFKRAGIEATIK
jgi:hypothetical protein